MLPIIQIGPFAMQTPGLILLIGLWTGLSLAEKLAPRFKTNPSAVYNLVFTAMVAGILGARLSYVAQYPNAFLNSPLSLISLNPGLLDPIGGVVIGIIATAIYANRKQYSIWPILDALTPLLAVLAIAFGLSHLASGDNFGMQTNLPWGIELWGSKRHPTQIYESILAISILGIFWIQNKNFTKPTSRVAGAAFWQFLSLSAAARLLIEGFRGDSMVLPNGWRIAQLVAWGILGFGLWMLERRNSTNTET